MNRFDNEPLAAFRGLRRESSLRTGRFGVGLVGISFNNKHCFLDHGAFVLVYVQNYLRRSWRCSRTGSVLGLWVCRGLEVFLVQRGHPCYTAGKMRLTDTRHHLKSRMISTWNKQRQIKDRMPRLSLADSSDRKSRSFGNLMVPVSRTGHQPVYKQRANL